MKLKICFTLLITIGLANAVPIQERNSELEKSIVNAIVEKLSQTLTTYLSDNTRNIKIDRFAYTVWSEENRNYMARQEQMNALEDSVSGSYEYIDPYGDLVVVQYSAGPDGYKESRTAVPNVLDTLIDTLHNTQGGQVIDSSVGVADVPSSQFGAFPVQESVQVVESVNRPIDAIIIEAKNTKQ